MTTAPAQTPVRDEISQEHKWDLGHIFSSWEEWDAAYDQLDASIEKLASLKGTLSDGPESVVNAFRLRDEMEKLAHKVYWYPSLMHDENMRDNEVEGRRFGVNLIPHTREVTTLGELAPGAMVNLEVDIIARYVERLTSAAG